MKCAYDSVYSCIYHMFCIFIFCCTTSYSTYVHLFVINLLTYYTVAQHYNIHSYAPKKKSPGSKGINLSGWHGLDMSITVTKRDATNVLD